MVEIQELFIILIVVMGVIGAVRGFLKELGVTLVLIATLFALDRLIPIVNNFINGGGFGFLSLGPVPETQSTDDILFVIFAAILVGGTFIAYQGETLAYEGKDPRGIVGLIVGILDRRRERLSAVRHAVVGGEFLSISLWPGSAAVARRRAANCEQRPAAAGICWAVGRWIRVPGGCCHFF